MLKRILAIVLVIAAIITCSAIPASAAAAGTMISNAVQVNYGQTYFKGWTSSTDHLNHYVKFVVPAQGTVNITATKPYDSEGEYGRMYFTVYNSNNVAVWDNHTYRSVNDISSSYNLNVGLAAGTYYLTIRPAFYVTSGLIETYYSLSYTKDAHCEVEPNGSGRQATPVTRGRVYNGWYGAGGGNYEENDYFKFNVTAGETVRITWLDFENLANTSTIIDYIDPSGDDRGVSYDFERNIDADGYGYSDVKVKQTGTAYLRLWNCSGKQAAYRFVVGPMACRSGNHAFGSSTPYNAAYHRSVCEDCGYARNLNHTWKRGTVTYPKLNAKGNALQSNGSTVYTCTGCGEKKVEKHTFPDVLSIEWYYKAVEFAVAKGYFSGHGDGTFGPGNGITRQDFVVVLARLAKADLSKYSGQSGFADVSPKAYYAKAIHWASANNVVKGYNNGKFGVNDKITREQLVTILYRYAMQKGIKVNVSSSAMSKLNAFKDSYKINPGMKGACAWALEKGVLSGKNATTFDPQGAATRAQVAAILMNISTKGIMPI